jgi:hypothetical protein
MQEKAVECRIHESNYQVWCSHTDYNIFTFTLPAADGLSGGGLDKARRACKKMSTGRGNNR